MQNSRTLLPKIQKILIAVDGSDNSFQACEAGGIIARGCDSKVSIVYAMPPLSIFSSPMKDEYQSSQMENARKSIDKAKSLLKTTSGMKAESEILHSRGSIADSLIKYAIRESSDLVVAGTRGLGGFKRMLLGSVSGNLVSNSTSSVLVVRKPKTKKLSFKKILVATDGSESASKAENLAIVLAKALGSKLTFISVVYLPPNAYAVGGGSGFESSMISLRDGAAKAVSKAAILAKNNDVLADTKVIDEFQSPVLAITRVGEKEDHDIIVVGTRGQTGLRKLALGSVAQGVVHYARCSVLVVK